ncbi:hypothetical protein [Cystobacter fuscus]|uniref:hypothetical protein n=1 Tax=Cystobacter fuscus TaxID=43 RepID=UPI002B2DC0B2|nr:hypothetical protein F0U63_09160 [Cystobacter fuscus]
MSVCSSVLAPGIQAFNEMVDAGKLCELAGFDSILLHLCKAGAGAITAEALVEVDKKILCAVYCCCKTNPNAGSSGQSLYDQCASETIGKVDEMMDGKSRYKSQTSYNMRDSPVSPLVERMPDGSLGTTPIPPTGGGWKHMGNRIEKETPGLTPRHGKDTRRPDVVIVRDPSRAPTIDNIARVVDFKFGNEGYSEGQENAYREMGGGRIPLTLDDEECDCGNQEQRQSALELIAAADTYKQSQPTTLERVGLGALTVVGAVATAALFLVPVDGPAGEVVAGGLTARAAAGVVRAAAMSAEMAVAARSAAAQMARQIFQTGVRAVPAY